MFSPSPLSNPALGGLPSAANPLQSLANRSTPGQTGLAAPSPFGNTAAPTGMPDISSLLGTVGLGGATAAPATTAALMAPPTAPYNPTAPVPPTAPNYTAQSSNNDMMMMMPMMMMMMMMVMMLGGKDNKAAKPPVYKVADKPVAKPAYAAETKAVDAKVDAKPVAKAPDAKAPNAKKIASLLQEYNALLDSGKPADLKKADTIKAQGVKLEAQDYIWKLENDMKGLEKGSKEYTELQKEIGDVRKEYLG